MSNELPPGFISEEEFVNLFNMSQLQFYKNNDLEEYERLLTKHPGLDAYINTRRNDGVRAFRRDDVERWIKEQELYRRRKLAFMAQINQPGPPTTADNIPPSDWIFWMGSRSQFNQEIFLMQHLQQESELHRQRGELRQERLKSNQSCAIAEILGSEFIPDDKRAELIKVLLKRRRGAPSRQAERLDQIDKAERRGERLQPSKAAHALGVNAKTVQRDLRRKKREGH